jgi:hypothetical protein
MSRPCDIARQFPRHVALGQRRARQTLIPERVLPAYEGGIQLVVIVVLVINGVR